MRRGSITAAFLWVLIFVWASFCLYSAFRSCEREDREMVRRDMKEWSWRHTRDRVLQDIRILKLEILHESLLLDNLEKENRGNPDHSFWKRFDEHRARVNQLAEEVETARRIFNVNNADEVEQRLAATREALRKYQFGH